MKTAYFDIYEIFSQKQINIEKPWYGKSSIYTADGHGCFFVWWKEAKRKGAFIYILHEFCSCRDHKVRTKAAELFAKLMSANLYGTEVKILLSQFLPTLFTEAMRDNAENSVHMFESKLTNHTRIFNVISYTKSSIARLHEKQSEKARSRTLVRIKILEVG